MRSLDPRADSFRPKEPDEDIIHLEVPCQNAIGDLMNLELQIRQGIAFAMRDICLICTKLAHNQSLTPSLKFMRIIWLV